MSKNSNVGGKTGVDCSCLFIVLIQVLCLAKRLCTLEMPSRGSDLNHIRLSDTPSLTLYASFLSDTWWICRVDGGKMACLKRRTVGGPVTRHTGMRLLQSSELYWEMSMESICISPSFETLEMIQFHSNGCTAHRINLIRNICNKCIDRINTMTCNND